MRESTDDEIVVRRFLVFELLSIVKRTRFALKVFAIAFFFDEMEIFTVLGTSTSLLGLFFGGAIITFAGFIGLWDFILTSGGFVGFIDSGDP